MKALKAIWAEITKPHHVRKREAIENFLAQSEDLVDLERRQKLTDRMYDW